MKKIFFEELNKFTKKDKNILLVVNDLGYGMVEPFVKKFPKNIYNAGVSEQSMMGYAADLQLAANVFVYQSEILILLDVLNKSEMILITINFQLQ